jgi:hypothetical protein
VTWAVNKAYLDALWTHVCNGAHPAQAVAHLVLRFKIQIQMLTTLHHRFAIHHNQCNTQVDADTPEPALVNWGDNILEGG